MQSHTEIAKTEEMKRMDPMAFGGRRAQYGQAESRDRIPPSSVCQKGAGEAGGGKGEN